MKGAKKILLQGRREGIEKGRKRESGDSELNRREREEKENVRVKGGKAQI